MEEFTKEEQNAIKRLKRSLNSMPESLRVYNCDANIYVCKIGISCMDLIEDVGSIATGCAVIMDVHDDSGYGSE